MNILINGESRNVADAIALSELLTQLDLNNRSFAIAITEQVIPRSQYQATVLQPADRVEMVRAVGGG